MDDMEKDACEWGRMDVRAFMREVRERTMPDPFPRRRHTPPRTDEGAAKWLRAYAAGILGQVADMELFYTLRSDDVGRATITAFGKKWPVVDFIGRILPDDVGKRVYRAPVNDGSDHILQVENNEQRDRRLSTH